MKRKMIVWNCKCGSWPFIRSYSEKKILGSMQRAGSLNRFVGERLITVPVVLVVAAWGPLTGQSASTLVKTPWILPGNESSTSGQQQLGSPARHDSSGSVDRGCRCRAGDRRGISAGPGASGSRPPLSASGTRPEPRWQVQVVCCVASLCLSGRNWTLPTLSQRVFRLIDYC